MQPQHTDIRTILSRIMLLLVCVCVLALGYVGYNIVHVRLLAQKDSALVGAQNSFMDGSFTSVEGQVMDAQKVTPGVSRDARRAQIQALSLSNDPKDQLEAFSKIKDDYDTARSKFDRATALNRLADFLVRNRNGDVFNMVFATDSFAPYKGASLPATVRNLASTSDAIYPTVYSKYWQTWFGSNVATTTEARQKRADRSLALLAQGDQLFAEKLKDTSSPLAPFDILYLYYIRGLVYEGVANAYPQKAFDEAQSSYVDGEKYYDSLGANPPALAQMRMPYLLVTHARLLARSEKPDVDAINTLLKRAVTLIEQNPSVHEHGYLAVVKRVSEGKSLIQDSDYKTFQDLAAASPDFKAFLEKHEVTFTK